MVKHIIHITFLIIGICFQGFSQSDISLRQGFEVNAGIGFRGISESKKMFVKSTVSLGYNKPVHPILDLKLLLEGFYSDRTDVYQGLAEATEKYSSGIQVGVDLHFDRLALTFGLGKYIYFKSTRNVWMYSNLGFRFRMTDHLKLLWIFKAHRNEADYMNFGIGYSF
ncbi:MAG: hypothetical protein ACI8P7_000673 [Candidatus Azotimanducaceae bacterium]|jgi:hypothetical protein